MIEGPLDPRATFLTSRGNLAEGISFKVLERLRSSASWITAGKGAASSPALQVPQVATLIFLFDGGVA